MAQMLRAARRLARFEFRAAVKSLPMGVFEPTRPCAVVVVVALVDPAVLGASDGEATLNRAPRSQSSSHSSRRRRLGSVRNLDEQRWFALSLRGSTRLSAWGSRIRIQQHMHIRPTLGGLARPTSRVHRHTRAKRAQRQSHKQRSHHARNHRRPHTPPPPPFPSRWRRGRRRRRDPRLSGDMMSSRSSPRPRRAAARAQGRRRRRAQSMIVTRRSAPCKDFSGVPAAAARDAPLPRVGVFVPLAAESRRTARQRPRAPAASPLGGWPVRRTAPIRRRLVARRPRCRRDRHEGVDARRHRRLRHRPSTPSSAASRNPGLVARERPPAAAPPRWRHHRTPDLSVAFGAEAPSAAEPRRRLARDLLSFSPPGEPPPACSPPLGAPTSAASGDGRVALGAIALFLPSALRLPPRPTTIAWTSSMTLRFSADLSLGLSLGGCLRRGLGSLGLGLFFLLRSLARLLFFLVLLLFLHARREPLSLGLLFLLLESLRPSAFFTASTSASLAASCRRRFLSSFSSAALARSSRRRCSAFSSSSNASSSAWWRSSERVAPASGTPCCAFAEGGRTRATSPPDPPIPAWRPRSNRNRTASSSLQYAAWRSAVI